MDKKLLFFNVFPSQASGENFSTLVDENQRSTARITFEKSVFYREYCSVFLLPYESHLSDCICYTIRLRIIIFQVLFPFLAINCSFSISSLLLRWLFSRASCPLSWVRKLRKHLHVVIVYLTILTVGPVTSSQLVSTETSQYFEVQDRLALIGCNSMLFSHEPSIFQLLLFVSQK